VNTENPMTSVQVADSATKLRWTRNGENIKLIMKLLYNIRNFMQVNN
jgi:hypothetical protein